MYLKMVGSYSTARARGCVRMAISRSSISDNRPAASAGAIGASNNIAAAGGGMAELEIESLKLRFGGLVVLDGISFAADAGELLALIGPNGAGKTSVLNCISGIYRGEGSIRFRGECVIGRTPHEIARLG